MKRSQQVGSNRTGTALAPEGCAEMVAATGEFPPSSPGDAKLIAGERIEYAKASEPPGTMPPASVGSMAKTAVKTIRGKQPTALLDKLGERLAFERSGTRLYEALLSKFDAYGSFSGGPSRADLEHILEEEHAHFAMLREAVEAAGGDPTAVTPSANVHATASKGFCAVLTDPRTAFVDGLEVVLLAELADNDCWDALIGLTETAGETALSERFGEARDHEREHLASVRAWLAAAENRTLAEPAPTREAARRVETAAHSRRSRPSRNRGRIQRKAGGQKKSGNHRGRARG